MKKLLIVPFLLFGSFAFAAEDNIHLGKRFGLGAGAGLSAPIWNNKFDDNADTGFMWDLHARYQFTDAHGLMFNWAKHNWENTDVDAQVYDLMYLYRSNPTGMFSGIWGLGAGVANLNDADPKDNLKFAARARAGIEMAMNDDLLLSAAIDYQYISKMIGAGSGEMPMGEIHAIVPQLNLTYFFGSSAQSTTAAVGAGAGAAAVASADSDKDGIANTEDKCPNTRPGLEVNAYGCTPDEFASTEIEVLFDTDSAELAAGPKPALDELAQFMEEHPNTKVQIQGHTDNTGPASLNQGLSQQRAEEVADYLKNNGIDESRLEAKGFGENQPAADNTTAAGRAENRRVMTIISQ
ncbi:OmpA family protein [Peredibacter starrii]|uniref:OmpA family protein n=1 Tax=Peredibacter starrii TaxID=28202 RepID=A0AAX4HSR2_9BACT|nr:OmpA family protein [Peredibacter starrii]WPU65949.1 OmpA family protein [Peredibacter starrii]